MSTGATAAYRYVIQDFLNNSTVMLPRAPLLRLAPLLSTTQLVLRSIQVVRESSCSVGWMWVFHTSDRPDICFAPPGAIPIEVAHFVAVDLIDVKLALRARRRILPTTRVYPEFASRKNLGIFNIRDGNFFILVAYMGVVVKMCLLAP